MPVPIDSAVFDSARRLSAGEIALAQLRSIVRSTGRALMKRVQRDSATVTVEYHGGHWARMLATEPWKQAASLEDFLIGNNVQPILAKVEYRPTRLPKCEYYRYRIQAQAELVRTSLGTEGELVELGSGWGSNIFALAHAMPGKRFIGLDISSNGVAAARAIAAHFGLSERMHFDLLDLTDATQPNWALVKGRDCLTFFCLEQIPYSIERVVANIVAAGPRRVLHVEPSVELLKLRRPADWANYAYVKSVDYQSDLFGVLREFDRSGRLRLINVGRAAFAPTLQNDGFTAVWEPAVHAVPGCSA